MISPFRRLASEHRRRPPRSPQDLVQQRELDLAEALAAELGPQMRGPQSLVLHLLLQRPQDGHHLRVLFVVRIEGDQIERFEFFDHEFFDPVQLRLVVRICFEVPHGGQPFPGAALHRYLR